MSFTDYISGLTLLNQPNHHQKQQCSILFIVKKGKYYNNLRKNKKKPCIKIQQTKLKIKRINKNRTIKCQQQQSCNKFHHHFVYYQQRDTFLQILQM